MTAWPKWRKTALVEAVQIWRPLDIPDEVTDRVFPCDVESGFVLPVNQWAACDGFLVRTLEGDHRAPWGSWLARGAKGDLYCIQAEIMAATYQSAILAPVYRGRRVTLMDLISALEDALAKARQHAEGENA